MNFGDNNQWDFIAGIFFSSISKNEVHQVIMGIFDFSESARQADSEHIIRLSK